MSSLSSHSQADGKSSFTAKQRFSVLLNNSNRWDVFIRRKKIKHTKTNWEKNPWNGSIQLVWRDPCLQKPRNLIYILFKAKIFPVAAPEEENNPRREAVCQGL